MAEARAKPKAEALVVPLPAAVVEVEELQRTHEGTAKFRLMGYPQEIEPSLPHRVPQQMRNESMTSQ